MTRSILLTLAFVAAVAVLSATGCNSTGVGDPCTPEGEYATYFLGFHVTEVNIESKSYQCQTRLCLANHFQGRVTCPYGQNSDASGAYALATGTPSSNTVGTPCKTPIGQNVDGIDPAYGNMLASPCTPAEASAAASGVEKTCGAAVLPNCTDRTASNAVYCSCRCMDSDGNKPSDQVFCDCPTGFTCTQLRSASNTGGDEGLTGGFCIKNGTQYDTNKGCPGFCNPMAGGCGKAQGV
jgi:hypothetical protein